MNPKTNGHNGKNGRSIQRASNVPFPSDLVERTTERSDERSDERSANNQIYTATEISKLLGVSDATVRTRWKSQLEQVYGGGSLQDSMGNYTHEAFLEFQRLQLAVCTQIPQRNNAGEIVYVGGTPLMVPNSHRVGWPKYKEQLMEHVTPERVEVEVVEEDVEISSMIVADNDDHLAIMDSIAFQYGDILNKFEQAGRVIGQQARAKLNKGFSEGFAESTDVAAESLKNFKQAPD